MSISFSNIGASFVQYFISIKWKFHKRLAFRKGTDKLRTIHNRYLVSFLVMQRRMLDKFQN